MTPLASALVLDGGSRWHPVTPTLGTLALLNTEPAAGVLPSAGTALSRPPAPGPLSPGPLAAGDACAVRPRGGRCPGAVVPAASAMAEEVRREEASDVGRAPIPGALRGPQRAAWAPPRHPGQ